MNITKLITFGKFFKSIMDTINSIVVDKKRTIKFKDILYCCLYMNGSSCSYSLANINMGINNIIDVSDTALKNKRNVYNYIYFKQISDTLVNFIYNDIDMPRIIAVDGTYIPLLIKLQRYGFRTLINDTYCTGLSAEKKLIKSNITRK